MEKLDSDQLIWKRYLKEEESFAALYENFVDRMFIYGCSLSTDESFVKDAIQEVFCRLLQRKESLGEIRNIRNFLFVALRNYIRKNTMLKHNRQRHLRQIQETADYSEHISLPQEGDSCLSLLLTEIEQLPTRQQEVLYLKYFEGMDYEEISQIMSVNYQVVRNYAYRGLSRLRKRLQSANRLVINWLILMPLLFFG